MARRAKRQKKPSLSEAVGIVEGSDTAQQTVIVATGPGRRIRQWEFIEVPFSHDGRKYTLIGQIELLVGEGIKVGSTTIGQSRAQALNTGQVQVGIASAVFPSYWSTVSEEPIETTRDDEKARIRATAKVIAFIDDKGVVSLHHHSIDYIEHRVYPAKQSNLEKVFSELDNQSIAPLEIGTLIRTQDDIVIPVVLDPTGFMRHTAVFGQSGSGKSFSFGILLEELIRKTDARILILDPNADYSKFSKVRTRRKIRTFSKREYTSTDHKSFKEDWKDRARSFLRFSSQGVAKNEKLTLHFSDISRSDQATLLGLDPLQDHEEYRVFLETVDSLGEQYTLKTVLDAFTQSPTVDKLKLRFRIENSGIDTLSIWGADSIVKKMRDTDWRFASIDLRDATPLERSLTAAAVLESIYRDVVRDRRVTFFVLEEAHNFCPAVPWNSHQNAPREILHEIAAEGRKFGAFLILLTQNPSKLSEQALFQCDNVILMKMTSGVEVQALASIVSDASSRLAQFAFNLKMGEAVCMGGIVKNQATVKFDLRKTLPGGEDVSKEWAKRKN